MQLIENKLVPSEGMHIVRISTNEAFEAEIYIPPRLSISDFTEITEQEYQAKYCEVRDEVKEQLKTLQAKNERLTEVITKIIETVVPKSLRENILNLIRKDDLNGNAN